MEYITEFSAYLGRITGIDSEYIKLTLLTILIFFVFGVIKSIIKKIYSNLPVNDKKKFFRNRKIRIILTAISFILVFLLWGEKLSGLITFISLISAGLTIAVREIIFNFFAGMYINITRPFEIEDRIEIDDVMGDVISKHALGFEILEIGKRVYGEQSTGRIIHIPNSYIFTKTLKNYTKVFKYIWDEIKVKIPLDSDIQNLDENVVKSINKHYIAYKYDYINFAEIIIYKWSITVILDIPPELLQDEKQLSENISDKGSWGTGNVRIKIQDDNNYEYILDLIRQSFDNEKNSNA